MNAKIPFLLFSLMFSLTALGMRSDQPSKTLRATTECPQISVECPDPADGKSPIKFKAIVKGVDAPENLSYGWSVSKGQITFGQGTATITVEAAEGERQGITATVEVNGVSLECSRIASCTTVFYE